VSQSVSVATAWGANLFYGTVELQRGSNRWTQLIAAQARLGEASGMPSSSGEPVHSYAAEIQARNGAVSWIRQHPLTWLRVRVRQWPWLLIDTGDYLPVDANHFSFGDALRTMRVSTLVLKLGFIGGNLVLVVLAARGAWSLLTRWEETLALWSFPLYLILAHVPVYVEPRYGLPLVPFLAVLGAEGGRQFVGLPHDATRRMMESRDVGSLKTPRQGAPA
jgi:hypothetical protein